MQIVKGRSRLTQYGTLMKHHSCVHLFMVLHPHFSAMQNRFDP